MTRTIFLALITLIGVQITTMASPTYRSVSFRDSVLNPIMFKAGLDPAKDLFSSDARALVSYINSWVRKLANEVDFPEWTTIEARTPDVNNVVALTTTPGESQIDRLLRVYLLDPRTTDGPLDIPFRRLLGGVSVGFEHGSQVWLKFMLPVPQFTSRIWNPTDTFSAGDLVYSVRAGECFKSRVNGNRGHDPGNFGPDPTSPFSGTPLPPTVTQSSLPGQSPLPANDKIAEIVFPADLPDPYPYDRIYAEVENHTGGAIIGNSGLNGLVLPWSTILATLVDDLTNGTNPGSVALPAGWTASVGTLPHSIRLHGPDDFQPAHSSYKFATAIGTLTALADFKIFKGYFAGIAQEDPTSQIAQFSLAAGDLVAGATYSLEITDASNNTHVVEYESENDSDLGIMAGLMSAMDSSTDVFFQEVNRLIATGTPNVLVLTTPTPIGIKVTISQAANPYWDTVPFPMVLADQTVRGAYADWLRSEGQHGKAMAEEQLVTQEQGNRTGQEMAPHPNQLTDQIGVEQ